MTTCNASVTPASDAIVSQGVSRGLLGRAFLYYYGATLICLLGISLGREYVKLCTQHPGAEQMDRADPLAPFAAWDGAWYRRIATEGYEFRPGHMSSIAFFPGYPLAASVLSRFTGLRAEVSLLLTAHAALYALFVLLVLYCRQRLPDAPAELRSLVLLCVGLFPSTFYFRMSYSESSFVACLLLGMYGMERDWNPVWVALIVGAATALRAVGVAMLLPFAEWMLFATDRAVRAKRRRAVACLPLAVWGIVGFMVFQALAFGTPLAFLKAQSCWQAAGSPQGVFDKIWGLVTFRPFWSVYLPLCPTYWRRFPPHECALLNMCFWNPIFVAATWAGIALGAKLRWLNRRELLLSIGLLFIPYVTHADRFGMHSGARYAAATFPFYFVLARLLWRHYHNVPLLCGTFACFGIGLCLYSAMFASWYFFY